MVVLAALSVLVALVALVRLWEGRSAASRQRRARRTWVRPEAHELSEDGVAFARWGWVAALVVAVAATALSWPDPAPASQEGLEDDLRSPAVTGLVGGPLEDVQPTLRDLADGAGWSVHPVALDPGSSSDRLVRELQAIASDAAAAACVQVTFDGVPGVVEDVSVVPGFC